MSAKKISSGIHGEKTFVSKRTTPVEHIDYLRLHGYGCQDGGDSGLWILWSDGFVESIDFSDDPCAALDAVLAARKFVPYDANITWFDGETRTGGAIAPMFGSYRPILVARKNKNNVTLRAMAEALSYAARHQGDTKGGAR